MSSEPCSMHPTILQVLLDETVMEAGTLQEVGLRNMAVRGWLGAG